MIDNEKYIAKLVPILISQRDAALNAYAQSEANFQVLKEEFEELKKKLEETAT